MRYVSIFSGVEAATLAWEPLGWEPVAFAEVDRFPSAVLAERWPDVPKRLSTATYAERSRSAGQLRASLSPIPMVVGDELHPDREMRVRWGGARVPWSATRCPLPSPHRTCRRFSTTEGMA